MNMPKITLVLVIVTCAAFAGQAAPPAHAAGFAPSFSFGSTGSGPGQFEVPRGVAVETSTGDVFVVDANQNKVIKLSAQGTEEGDFEGGETPQGEFAFNTFRGRNKGIAVDNSSSPSKGDVYVSTGSVVDKFKPKGIASNEPNEYVYVCQLTGPGGGCAKEGGTGKFGEEFFDVTGVAVGVTGDVYVVNGGEEPYPVDVFGPEGEDLPALDTNISYPVGIAVNAAGDIYVEIVNGGVEPEAVFEFSSSGVKSEPALDSHGSGAVAVDPASGEVFIVDSELLTVEGEERREYYIARYGAAGNEIEQFGRGELGRGGPGESEGIAYSGFNGDIYVTDHEHNEVHVFELENFKLPVVQVGSPEEPTPGDVTLEGSVNPEGEEGTNSYFSWGETELYGSKTPVESVPKETTPVPVTALLSDLEPNTIYHYRLFAYNTHDQTKPVDSGDQEFTTAAVSPVVAGEPASFLATRAATLLAKVNPEHSATKFHFEYGTDGTYGQDTPEESAGSGLTSDFVSQRVEGLTPGMTYEFRAVATNEEGMTERGRAEIFTTGTEPPPEVVTGAASDVTQGGAVVSGTVNPEGFATSYVLELGTEPGSYQTQMYGAVGAGTEAVPVSVALSDLTPGVTYRYRFGASNANSIDGPTYGAEGTFTTLGTAYSLVLPPAVPLLATPDIVFPTGSQANTGSTVVKKLTNAQRLAAALRTCRMKVKGKRAGCEKRARKQYSSVKVKAKGKHNKQH
jgi:hypothetical protein